MPQQKKPDAYDVLQGTKESFLNPEQLAEQRLLEEARMRQLIGSVPRPNQGGLLTKEQEIAAIKAAQQHYLSPEAKAIRAKYDPFGPEAMELKQQEMSPAAEMILNRKR